MKRLNVKQVILYIGGILTCQLAWMGCYPMIPVYFTSVFLQDSARWIFASAMLAGVILFVPAGAAVKYVLALVVTAVTIRLFEWVEGRCTTVCAALAATIATFMLSISGMALNIRDHAGLPVNILEAGFVFSAILLGSRLVDRFLQLKLLPEKQERGHYQEQRLENYADSFSGLSRIFSQMSSARKEFSTDQIGKMQKELTGSVCINCSQCAICWEQETSPMYAYLAYMLQSLSRTGEPDGEIVVQMQEYCPYTDTMIQEAVRIFEKARLNLAWYNRLLENREVIAQQLDAMAYIMEDCATDITEITRENRKRIAEVKYRAKERGIAARQFHLYETKKRRWQLTCEASTKYGGCISMKELARAVSAGLGRRMRPHREERAMVSAQGNVITFEEDTHFHEMHAVVRRVKDGGSVSGDNYSFLEMDEGQLVVMLSDGMGSGSMACRESELVLELLERFLLAGFSRETALKMMNSAMVIRGDDDLYSTVDICSIDLYSGMCELYKVGAAATFLKHNDYVEYIASASLPVGVSNHMDILETKKQLEDGDVLVMMSDGVVEYLGEEDPEAAMSGMISRLGQCSPGQMAELLMDEVLRATGGKARDDMTILVTGVWEK